MTQASPPRAFGSVGGPWAVLSVLLLLLGSFMGLNLHQEWLDAQAEQGERLTHRAKIIEDNLSDRLGTVYKTLEKVRRDRRQWARQLGHAEESRLLLTLAEGMLGVQALSVLDRRGEVLAASQERSLGQDLSTLEVFQTARRANDTTAMHLSAPTGTPGAAATLHLGRVMVNDRGDFDGLVIVELDPDYFRSLLDSVRYSPDMWASLVHTDGKLFMMSPEPPDAARLDGERPDGVFSRHLSSGQPATLMLDAGDPSGRERLVAQRTVRPGQAHMDKGLVVAVARERQALLEAWRRGAYIESGTYLVLAVLSAMLLYSYERRRQDLRRLATTSESQRRSSEALLAESEERYRKAFITSPDAINITRLADGLYLDVNEGFERLTGWTRTEVVGRTAEEMNIWHDMASRQQLVECLTRDGYCENLEADFVTKDGRILHGLMSANLIEMKGEACLLSVTRDLTARTQAENQVRKLSMAVEQSSESIVITNLEARIEYVNEAFVQKTGYSRAEVMGQNPRILHSGKTDPAIYRGMWETLQRGLSWKGEFHNRHKDGHEFSEFAVISPIRQSDGRITHYVGVKEDITARKAAEDQINALAFFDPLTGLPNRRLLLDRLSQAVAACARTQRHGALLFIDLDNFKTLNDTLGHNVGDQLLRQVALRLSACVREGDTVARLGGDEFVVMLVGLSPSRKDAAALARESCEKILHTLTENYLVGEAEVHSTASIGVTLFVDHLEATDDLLKQADLAMYQAKGAGRNTVRFFDPQMQAIVMARAELEIELRRALQDKQFLLHYQPQVNSQGHVTGVEALVRWRHPKRGLVPPMEFIPLAESTGLILPLGHWVLETACAQLAQWATQPIWSELSVSVNVSAIQFHQPGFVQEVREVLEQTQANAMRLKLELTESSFITDIESMITKMTALKAMGVGFSLDDFGTGYSSLSYLKRLPLDQLKIDQGFVRNILIDSNDAAIAKMVLALAASLGLGAVAEGVETAGQRHFLAELGCTAFQGYLFGRPMSVAALAVQYPHGPA